MSTCELVSLSHVSNFTETEELSGFASQKQTNGRGCKETVPLAQPTNASPYLLDTANRWHLWLASVPGIGSNCTLTSCLKLKSCKMMQTIVNIKCDRDSPNECQVCLFETCFYIRSGKRKMKERKKDKEQESIKR